ncbi:type VII secretion protein EsxB [Mycobacterium kyorinense]|uniref:ESAT-6-like protein n=1 Tax=Mycobacterium kyorinense TaxID=487514 RepID=A0A1A2Z823_9MYCO|nr:WXG100 family type VII secretion target [Mycobacterium kyorinense]OBI46395.1 type VII secretion protein EsxB [Mycobacterium kyorinense]
MGAPMEADPAVLATEASNFERIAGEIKGVMARVEGTAQELMPQLQGSAGNAAQAALARYNEAALAQVKELDDVTENLQQSNIHYTSTDEDQAAGVAAAMNF